MHGFPPGFHLRACAGFAGNSIIRPAQRAQIPLAAPIGAAEARVVDLPPLDVLIVDDDPTTAAMLRGLLRGMGPEFQFEATIAGTGAAAREQFKRGVHQLVLLDYLLPDEDGLGLLAALSLLPEARRPVVIMLTGAGSEQVAVEAMKLGAKDYVVKTSLNHATLRRAIAGALERRRLEARLAESTGQLRRHNAQMESDLAMAREVQLALLPHAYPLFPDGVSPEESRLAFCHRWRPSHKVAGDYFTVFRVSDTVAGVFQCDVMGHGVRAALITALVRGLLREQQAHAADPGAFLGARNRQLQSLLERVGDMVFVTAAYGTVDAATGEVRLANAGHTVPLHLERRAGRATPRSQPYGAGPALGLMPDFAYDTLAFTLAPGDALLLFTDGIHEVHGPAGEDFGQEGFAEAVTTRLGEPTPRLLDTLLADVQAFRGLPIDAPMPDDVCLLAVDRVPQS